MYKYLILITIFIFTTYSNFAQCTETDETKVLLVGDSWAFFMGVDQTIDRALAKWGHSHYKFFTNTVIAENGAETEDFLTPSKQAEIIAQLNAHPNIEVIHLSIGGNDLLGDWNVNFTQAQTDSLMDATEIPLLAVIDFLKTVKPGIRIIWSGYTYPNFAEVIEDAAPFQTNHPFYNTWEGMGFPTFLQVNTLMDTVAKKMEIYAAGEPQVEYVNVTSILQYTFGQTSPLSVPPGGTYPPFTAPYPDGYPDYPSPKEAMRDYFLTKDCFHLSPKGFDDMIEYEIQKFYHKYLMDDQYFLAEGSTKNGSVSSNGNISTALMLGENAGEIFTTALSFNTTMLPDTNLQAASIFLRRESLTGTNPISGNLQVKVINGNFGLSTDVEAVDFNTLADATDTPCLFGSNDGDGHWIRLDLPSTMLPYINQNDITQFLITAPSATGGVVTFSDVSNPDFAPVLNVTYSPYGVGIADEVNQNGLTLYPNPTTGLISIETPKVNSIEVANILGETVLTPILKDGNIDISSLPKGIYLLNLHTDTGVIGKRVVKE